MIAAVCDALHHTEYPLTQKEMLCLLPGVLLDYFGCCVFSVVVCFRLMCVFGCCGCVFSIGWIGKQMLAATAGPFWWSCLGRLLAANTKMSYGLCGVLGRRLA